MTTMRETRTIDEQLRALGLRRADNNEAGYSVKVYDRILGWISVWATETVK